MPFGRETALRAAAGLTAVGVAWVAVAFFALGLYQWLMLYWGEPGAAFATAGVCLLLAGAIAMIALRHAPAPLIQNTQQPAALGQNTSLISALKDLSQDHPFLAVGAAAILGAVGAADETKRR